MIAQHDMNMNPTAEKANMKRFFSRRTEYQPYNLGLVWVTSWCHLTRTIVIHGKSNCQNDREYRPPSSQEDTYDSRSSEQCDVNIRVRGNFLDGTVQELIDPEAHGDNEEKDRELQANKASQVILQSGLN